MTTISIFENDTFFGGVLTYIPENEETLSIIGATINIPIRKNTKAGKLMLTLSVGQGVTIIDSTHANIDKQILSELTPGLYFGDVETTLLTGENVTGPELKFNIKDKT